MADLLNPQTSGETRPGRPPLRRAGRRRERFWARYAAWYDLLWDDALTHLVGEQVARAVPPGTTVIEVGAGTGLITTCLRDAGHRVQAYEPDPSMRDRFRTRHPTVPCGDLAIEDLAGEDIAIEDAASPPATDAVTIAAVNVLHLTEEPLEALDRLKAIAGPDGRTIVVTPAPGVTLTSVVRAKRHLGVRPARLARFVALHTVLAPLALVTGARPNRIDQIPLPRDEASTQGLIAGVSELLTFDGTGDIDRERVTSAPEPCSDHQRPGAAV